MQTELCLKGKQRQSEGADYIPGFVPLHRQQKKAVAAHILYSTISASGCESRTSA